MIEDVPTAPLPPAVRRLRRVRHRRVLGGVAGGLARYTDRNAVLVRLAFLALAPLWGLGIALYALAWVTVPAEDRDESAADRVLRRLARSPAWLGVLLLGAAALLLVGGFGGEGLGVPSGLVLIAAGIALFRSDAQPPPAGRGGGATAVWDPPAPAEPRPARAPRRRREPSFLGRLTVGTTLLLLGGLALLDLAGVGEITAEQLLALALAAVGVGLVVGARFGRARGLILLGVPLLGALALVNLLGMPLSGGVGELWARPATPADVRDEYRLLFGSAVLDFSGVTFRDRPTEVTAGVGLGELTVIVPEDTAVEVNGSVRAGLLDVFDRVDEGTELQRTVTGRGDPGGGRLVLDLEGGVGAVTVRRAAEGTRYAAP